ncbi:type VI secretion protein, partial [Acidithiobacillus ferrooxidans]|nr:type VI secretion protein [Acidithiobacillus ferrooxidans]
RGRQDLGLRHLVVLTGLDRGLAVKDYGIEIPDQSWKRTEIPEAALDDQLAHERRNPPKEMLDPATGFAAEWHRRLLDRRKQKEKERARQKKQARKQAKPQRGSEIE